MVDDILDHLAQLARLRDAIEERFPRAREFRRPGFDDPEYAVST